MCYWYEREGLTLRALKVRSHQIGVNPNKKDLLLLGVETSETSVPGSFVLEKIRLECLGGSTAEPSPLHKALAKLQART